MTTIAIAIPARYGSTRFPGKPLAEIAGKTMLHRVYELATSIAASYDDIHAFITTEDQRIADHAKSLGATCIMTRDDCPTGSDRVLAALRQLDEKPDYVINLQGDAPFTPAHVIQKIIETLKNGKDIEVATPIHQLSWDDLDRLRNNKKETPFSGTTVTVNKNGQALWFSKQIIPSIRNESKIKNSNPLSSIYQHMGVYAYRIDILEKFCDLPQGHYEQLEGLEQLRLLENGIPIQTIPVEIESGVLQSGIDTPEDLERAEKFLAHRDEAS